MAQLGIQVVVLGVGMVAIVLLLLVIATSILGKISSMKRIEQPEELIETADRLQIAQASDKDLVAAITAAVYAVLSSEQVEKSNLDFVVRSIKRI